MNQQNETQAWVLKFFDDELEWITFHVVIGTEADAKAKLKALALDQPTIASPCNYTIAAMP